MPPATMIDPSNAANSPAEAGEPADSAPEPVEVIWGAGGRCGIDLDWIEGKLAAVCTAAGRPVERLTVRIVADAEMARLHERHAGVKGTTDVLTFDATPSDGAVDGDVAVCVDEAVRRAAEFGHPVERELLLYAVHGLLHCLGFDDRNPADHQRMHAEEDRLLEAIGVGRTFAPTNGRADRQAK